MIDGGCRDVRLIEAIGFPVFARFVTPEDSTWRWEVTATQEPITIGTVRVEPGDWVVGDEDGVVVVPATVAEDVLTAAEAKVGTENLVRDAVRDGMTPLEAYERYDLLSPTWRAPSSRPEGGLAAREASRRRRCV